MFRTLLCLLLFGFTGIEGAYAQAFPTRHITIVVPYPPGGATDVAIRPILDAMGAHLGQSLIIENVGGAGSTLGTGKVARAAPDGYTLLAQQVSLAAAPALFPKLTFDVARELTGVGLINTNPSMIVSRKSLAANTLPELVEWVRKTGPDVKFAHAGAGSMAHLCAVVFARSLGTQVNIVPYRGGNAVVTDILGGHADLFCSGAGLVLPQVKAGTMKAFAVTSKGRYDATPELPSLVEAGYKELEINFWQGLFAPAGTPKPVLDRLNAALRHALADPKVRANFAAAGMNVYPDNEQTPEAATALLQSEITRWGEVIRANKIEIAQ